MKIVIDDRIPFIKGALEPFAEVNYLPGGEIKNSHLRDADALLIRTRTCCDKALLHDTTLKFIGTATIGFDHIDTEFCNKRGIAWTNAPGCNAGSVTQYIASALVHLAQKYRFSLKDRAIGIVGVGNVGSKVVQMAELMGMHVYLCDPPRVRKEGLCGFISLDGIIRECDIITFHVPLNYEGDDKTFHMINNELLSKVNRNTFIINASRGEVVETNALKDAVYSGSIAGSVLDVWENEPRIDRQLMNLSIIATPHVAGYSADGKANGTSMIIQAFSRHFKLGIDNWAPDFIPDPVSPEIRINCDKLTSEEIISKAILATYNIADDDSRLRGAPASFEKQREDYPLRREFNAYSLVLENAEPTVKRILRKMGFKVI